MAHRPPPFAALRALEAACRHRSYSAAAGELGITHSAISQAVRRLEDEIGCKLFNRRGSVMQPTGASLALAAAYAEAAGLVDRAVRQTADPSPNSLRLRAPAQLARMWLTPLLPELAMRFPGLSLCLRTADAGDTEFDLAIQAQPPKLGYEARAFANPALRAYASPILVRRLALDTPAALLTAPLLIERDGAHWTDWFRAAGLDGQGPLRGTRFDDCTGVALEAAVRGAGVALGDDLSVRFALGQGDLIPVCPEVAGEGRPLWTVWRPEHTKSDLIEALANWLGAQAAAGDPDVIIPARPSFARLSA